VEEEGEGQHALEGKGEVHDDEGEEQDQQRPSLNDEVQAGLGFQQEAPEARAAPFGRLGLREAHHQEDPHRRGEGDEVDQEDDR
jgi:hypothetical protein